MAIAELGLAPAKLVAECPPRKHSGEDPIVSRALCSANPQRERKMALRWVSVDAESAAPMERDRSEPFLVMLILVW